MKTAKLGAIFLISLMALAGAGVGYAAWFDTITVTGTVNTGSVGWDITGYSCTFVWKIHGLNDYTDWGNEIYVDYASLTEADSQVYVQNVYPSYTIELISFATAAQTMSGDPLYADDDSVTVVFDNLFPCIYFEADFTIKYTGSVPGKINAIDFDLGSWDDALTPYVTVTVNEVAFITNGIFNPVYGLGYQLHEGEEIHVVIMIHIPQTYANEDMTEDLMSITGSNFDVTVEVIQWNEYGIYP